MRRLFLTISALCLSLLAVAQSPREEIRKNLRLSGCNFAAYPAPQQPKLTPAPKGKRPFYISHYGRHGSRHHTKDLDYDYAFEVLRRADGQQALSPLGRDVLFRLAAIRQEASGRLGDLTELGMQQSRDIARRMVERFPEVFEGDAPVDAHSSVVPRCILSMSCALLQMQRLNPRLDIRQQASASDDHFLRIAAKNVSSHDAVDAYQRFCARHPSHQRVVGSLFADTAYMNRYVNADRLNYYLFRLASNLQSVELSRSMTLYDLFTDDEIYENWLKENAWWFLGYGFCDLSGGNLPFGQAGLLRHLIEQADSSLSQPRPGCQLRFGHETSLLPLVCLLDVNGFGQRINDLDQLERKGWACHRVFPMGGNLQFIFYRSGPGDPDVVFKVLLNENEATLPLKTDMAPYYHWSDFRRHYLDLLDAHDNPPSNP